jgi:hypothetical protein
MSQEKIESKELLVKKEFDRSINVFLDMLEDIIINSLKDYGPCVSGPNTYRSGTMLFFASDAPRDYSLEPDNKKVLINEQDKNQDLNDNINVQSLPVFN